MKYLVSALTKDGLSEKVEITVDNLFGKNQKAALAYMLDNGLRDYYIISYGCWLSPTLTSYEIINHDQTYGGVIYVREAE